MRWIIVAFPNLTQNGEMNHHILWSFRHNPIIPLTINPINNKPRYLKYTASLLFAHHQVEHGWPLVGVSNILQIQDPFQSSQVITGNRPHQINILSVTVCNNVQNNLVVTFFVYINFIVCLPSPFICYSPYCKNISSVN